MEVNTIRRETDTLYDTARSGLSYGEFSTGTLASTDRISSASVFGNRESITAARTAMQPETYMSRREDEREAAVNALYPERTRTQTYERESVEPAMHTQTAKTTRLFVGDTYSAFDTVSRTDIAPSATTMQYADYQTAQAEVAAPAREPLSKKAKMAIAIYSAIVVVIAALVIVTGAMIGAIAGDVATLNTEVAAQQTVLSQTASDLEALQAEDYVALRAQNELDMVQAGETQSVDLVEYQEPASVTAPTNGFDRFLDWFSQVFA